MDEHLRVGSNKLNHQDLLEELTVLTQNAYGRLFQSRFVPFPQNRIWTIRYPVNTRDLFYSYLAPSRYCRVVVVVRCVHTESATRKRIPENAFIRACVPVHVSLDPCIASCQD